LVAHVGRNFLFLIQYIGVLFFRIWQKRNEKSISMRLVPAAA